MPVEVFSRDQVAVIRQAVDVVLQEEAETPGGGLVSPRSDWEDEITPGSSRPCSALSRRLALL